MKNVLRKIAFAAYFISTIVFAGAVDEKKLQGILEAQPDEIKVRYDARHPAETISFFGITPDMHVIEALPGDGWYSKILLPYLGDKGQLTGVDYNTNMWSKFDWVQPDFIEERKAWPTTWPENVQSWGIKDSAKVSAAAFGNLPSDFDGKLDAVLFIRALHNLSRFEKDGKFLSQALEDTYRVLKPGGIVGVVQHRTDNKDLQGETGYLEINRLKSFMKKAGFTLVAESDINANPKDKADGIVWRLPPTYHGVSKSDAKFKEYSAIGESNRMTLKFIKPE